MQQPPAPAQIAGGRCPGREVKGKTAVQQPARHHAPALKGQLGFRAQRERADIGYPSHRRQAERHAPRRSQGAHKLFLRHRPRRGQVDRAGKLGVLQHPACGGPASASSARVTIAVTTPFGT
jgi:hypothetical protein